MLKEKEFRDINGKILIVKHRKSTVFFELERDIETSLYLFDFIFDKETFKRLYDYLFDSANKAWDGIVLKEANSFASDYDEYYDKELDSNGNIHIKKENICISRPSNTHSRLYKFDKRKISSFLFDFNKLVNKI